MTQRIPFERGHPEPLNPRTRRLLLSQRRQQALQERDGDLLPVVCRECGLLLGLAEPIEEVFCTGCGKFSAPDDDLGSDIQMVG